MSLRIRIVAASGKLFLALGLSLGLTGTAFAGYLGGLEAYKRGEYETALEEWSVAARLGDFRAQFGVGILYLYGRGAERDPIGAVGFFKEASARGYPDARYALGVMHQDGTGVTQNFAEAARLYELAAWQGMAKAQNNLGILLAVGRGVERDPVMAHVWFALAEAAGVEAAVRNRLRIVVELSEAQLTEAQRMATAWSPTAAPEPPPEIAPEPEPAPTPPAEDPVAAPVEAPVEAAVEAPADAPPPPPLLIVPAP